MRKLIYIIEGASWSTDWDGKSIVANLSNDKIRAETSVNPRGYFNSIIHLGSFHLFFEKDLRDNFVPRKIDASNKIILTVFHLNPKEDKQKIKILAENHGRLATIHTSCQITKELLVSYGLPAEKIVVIPLGVDLDIFQPLSADQRTALKRKNGLPENKTIIGSFQKDGVGWEEGEKPKLIKGPDIFCNTIEQLSSRHLIFVVLTGPARGYVKKRLEKAGVPFKHYFLKDFLEIPKYYHLLDLYLIASRAEGGPKALVESWATGTPLVSTRVGMVPDIAADGQNVLWAESEEEDKLADQAEKVITQPDLAKHLVSSGQEEVKKYSWKIIAQKYYEQLYRPLINA